MTPDELTWFYPLKPVEEAAIAAVEAALGVRFPDDYRVFLRAYQGGTPNQTDFHLKDEGRSHVSVGSFLSVERADSDYIPRVVEVFSDVFPPHVIPIARDGGGNFVMLDLRAGAATISWWQHESIGEPDEYTPIADSFAAFIDLLYEPDLEAETKLD